MRFGGRTRRGLVALLLALPLLGFGVPAGAAEDEEEAKNLSTPVVLADGAALALAAVTVPGPPVGQTDPVYTDYYTVRAGAVWGADRIAATDPVAADAKWGDNLMYHQFAGRRSQPIRVEMNLFADDPAAFPGMYGYPMVSLGGSHRDEIFGTLGVAEATSPMVYTPDATLAIYKMDATGQYNLTVVAPRAMTAEVNASGKVIYGFNWGRPSGVPAPTPGSYRLVFTVGAESLVNLVRALPGDGEPLFPPAPITDGKTSMLDIVVGSTMASVG